jgi:hypothetical protein
MDKPIDKDEGSAPDEPSDSQPNGNGHANPAPFDQDDLVRRLTHTHIHTLSHTQREPQGPEIRISGV